MNISVNCWGKQRSTQTHMVGHKVEAAAIQPIISNLAESS
jgi:hypothetical protein